MFAFCPPKKRQFGGFFERTGRYFALRQFDTKGSLDQPAFFQASAIKPSLASSRFGRQWSNSRPSPGHHEDRYQRLWSGSQCRLPRRRGRQPGAGLLRELGRRKNSRSARSFFAAINFGYECFFECKSLSVLGRKTSRRWQSPIKPNQ